MTHEMNSNAPESERSSQRRTRFELCGAEDTTDVGPVVGLPRRDTCGKQRSTAPAHPVPTGDSVALIAFTTGAMTGAVVRVEPQTCLTIGRSEGCSVQIDHAAVSRLHARLSREGQSFWLTDAGSTNGTFVNGNRVRGAVALRSGDSVRIGTRHGFRFLVGDEQELKALAVAYENATRDSLTGLLNRRMFDEALDSEVAFARRHATALALLVLDIDRFKNVNDVHGHATGDSLLRAIGEQLLDVLRAEDIAARTGGEEFGVVVRGVDKAGAFALAQRIATRVSAVRLNAGGSAVQVTVSIGVASLDECNCSHEASELARLADARLYKAKRERNCVVAE